MNTFPFTHTNEYWENQTKGPHLRSSDVEGWREDRWGLPIADGLKCRGAGRLHSSRSTEVQSLFEAEDNFEILNVGSWQPVRKKEKKKQGFRDVWEWA